MVKQKEQCNAVYVGQDDFEESKEEAFEEEAQVPSEMFVQEVSKEVLTMAKQEQ